LRIGGAILVFASHHELAGDPGGQRRGSPQKGQGRVRLCCNASAAPFWMTCSMFMQEEYKKTCMCKTS
jgi:hypothetical protein